MNLKKLFSAALAVLLLLSLFSGCEVEDPTPRVSDPSVTLPPSESFPPPTDYIKYSGQWEETDEPLVVCIPERMNDIGFCEDVEDLLKYLTGSPVKLEWVIIPEYADTETEGLLTRLRTELLSGDGPDVFLYGRRAPIWLPDGAPDNFTVLFPMPEKLLYNDLFLPLDGLLENPQYMHPENFQSTVMAAGRTEQGQLILPTVYTCAAAFYDKSKLSGPLPENLKEMADSPDEVIVAGSDLIFAMGPVADCQTDSLLFSDDELQELTAQAFSIKQRSSDAQRNFLDGNSQGWWESMQPTGELTLSEMFQGKGAQKDYAVLPQWDRTGGVTARIERYAAVNRNTKQANNAMFLLDVLLSPECLSSSGFEDTNSATPRLYGRFSSVLNDLSATGLVIDTTVFHGNLHRKAQDLRAELDSRITGARFRSDLDDVLYDLNMGLMFAESELDALQNASNAYDRLLMVLAE